ncbi:GNAT family N-acetyltransferase [uncultured Jatrophihabitans sp.]|uniref:GNAT family N-acetyltransferase n=1 Tax=uncultured Jatrophihabitans sp. TaxID=1610747 RepID=UPI0035CA0603
MLEPSWQGRRVSVRRVVERRADGRLLQGDLVGELVALDEVSATVSTARGQVETPLALITAARLVPPSTAEELALERSAALLLQPAHVEQLSGWLLRADAGFTARANSALPVGQLTLPLDEALAQARRWYAERGLPLQFQVPVESRRLLDAELGERGWPASGGVDVLVAPLHRLAVVDSASVELADEPDDGWLALYRGGAGLGAAQRALLTRPAQEPEIWPRAARHAEQRGATGPGPTVFAAVREHGEVIATARGRVSGDWVGVMAVEVAPAARRRGLAGAVMRRLAGWAVERGATRGYVQVSIDNATGLALYERLGFWRHHSYHYRLDPGVPAR